MIPASDSDRDYASMIVGNDSSAEKHCKRLLLEAKAGDTSALTRLLEADREYLRLIASAELDSDVRVKESESDVVQDSIVEARQAFSDFRGENQNQWRSWLRTILKNNMRDIHRRYIDAEKRSIQKEYRLDDQNDVQHSHTDTPSRQLVRREESDQLSSSMEKLPEHYQQVLRLRYWERKAYDDIAAKMDSTSEAVRKLVYRAVEALVDDLQEPNDS